MNKTKDNPLPGESRNNILHFPTGDAQEKKEVVDIFLCSKCAGPTFFLLSDSSNRIACTACQNVIDANWFPGLSC